MRAIDIIDILDQDAPDWRDYPDLISKQAGKDSQFRADLAFAFFHQNIAWLDDVTPAVCKFQMEWVLQVFDNCTSASVLEETAKEIFAYIQPHLHEWLLEEEANAVAWG